MASNRDGYVSNELMLKISGALITLLVVGFCALAMNILITIQSEIKDVKRVVDGICDTQAQYWPDHKCKRP